LAVALAGNVYQFVRGEHLARDLALVQVNMQRQMAKLNDTTSSALSQTQQRFDLLESELETATNTTLRQLRSELKKSDAQLAQSVEQKRQQLVSQMSDLQVDTSEKLGRVSSDLQNTGSDVKQFSSDLSSMSGAVATNSKELAALKELGERNYFEFDLTKAKVPQKFGDIRLQLKKTDPKHNRYTVEVVADDKRVEKKDRTINEPVQLYVSGSRQPYEIVVNQVKKNEVIGYVAAPKVKHARGQTS
jgi:F0F1-type ATP synthase membrane subunit b/b'